MHTVSPTQINVTAPGSQPSNASFFKTSGKYVMEAVGEGIKQSLNGMDINVEFITLTARSFAQISGKTVKNIIAKYKAAGRQLAAHRFNYNSNNTTFSHS